MESVLKTISPARSAYISNSERLNDLPKVTKLEQHTKVTLKFRVGTLCVSTFQRLHLGEGEDHLVLYFACLMP